MLKALLLVSSEAQSPIWGLCGTAQVLSVYIVLLPHPHLPCKCSSAACEESYTSLNPPVSSFILWLSVPSFSPLSQGLFLGLTWKVKIRLFWSCKRSICSTHGFGRLSCAELCSRRWGNGSEQNRQEPLTSQGDHASGEITTSPCTR